MKQRDIFIVSQDGLSPQANQIAIEAIHELMECFPIYKNDYPITNLGAWKDSGYIYPENGRVYLAPYKSTRWHIENAKRVAKDTLKRGRPTANMNKPISEMSLEEWLILNWRMNS